jgi:hypothetical protein
MRAKQVVVTGRYRQPFPSASTSPIALVGASMQVANRA